MFIPKPIYNPPFNGIGDSHTVLHVKDLAKRAASPLAERIPMTLECRVRTA